MFLVPALSCSDKQAAIADVELSGSGMLEIEHHLGMHAGGPCGCIGCRLTLCEARNTMLPLSKGTSFPSLRHGRIVRKKTSLCNPLGTQWPSQGTSSRSMGRTVMRCYPLLLLILLCKDMMRGPSGATRWLMMIKFYMLPLPDELHLLLL